MSSVGHPWINRSLQFVHSRLGEFVHLCAIYLGIAVLVTIAAGAAVPTIRDQGMFLLLLKPFYLLPFLIK